MSKLYQITEDDLAELERVLPDILSRQYAQLDNRLRVQWRKVRDIVANVRWNYGPPLQVVSFPADGPIPDELAGDGSEPTAP